MLRVRSEARWIERVIRSIQPLCERIFVFDDHSDDGTPEICESLGCKVFRSTFTTLDESRDKNFLLEQAWKYVPTGNAGPDSWYAMVCIDGDEELEPGGCEMIRKAMSHGVNALALPIPYLWDSEEMIRVDGVYKNFNRISVWRMVSRLHEFRRTSGRDNAKQGKEEVNFHCGNAPKELLLNPKHCPARLLHYGYIYREDRIRKYHWYNERDANNKAEDRYRHVVVGDLFPADSVFRHGGPLKLEPLVLKRENAA